MVVGRASRHRFNKNSFLQNGYCWTGRERRIVSAGNQRSIYLRISFIFSSVGLLVGRGGKTERDMDQRLFVFVPFSYFEFTLFQLQTYVIITCNLSFPLMALVFLVLVHVAEFATPIMSVAE